MIEDREIERLNLPEIARRKIAALMMQMKDERGLANVARSEIPERQRIVATLRTQPAMERQLADAEADLDRLEPAVARAC